MERTQDEEAHLGVTLDNINVVNGFQATERLVRRMSNNAIEMHDGRTARMEEMTLRRMRGALRRRCKHNEQAVPRKKNRRTQETTAAIQIQQPTNRRTMARGTRRMSCSPRKKRSSPFCSAWAL
jgi:hypothetical protein